MGRPPSVTIDGSVDQGAKQLIRWISKVNVTNLNTGVDSVADIDKQLGELYADGFELFSTHYLGETPEGYGVLYILVKK